MKLSDRQKEAIKAMREGFELGRSDGWAASTWLQFGGCGKGGEYKKILFSTFDALRDKGLIQVTPNQPAFRRPTIYQLTELGKTITI